MRSVCSVALAVCGFVAVVPREATAGAVEYVVHVSVDGLRSDVITSLGAANLPHFYRMRAEGAFTDNARTDYDVTVTLPNHVTQLTGRAVYGPAGHNWTSNDDPPFGVTLHTNKGSYIAGVCDVAHDNGLRTGLYASKSKFSLFDVSWNATSGAPDVTGPDNGRDKVDVYVYNGNTATLTNRLVTDMKANPFRYAFLHLTDPDTIGHSSGWNPAPGTPYANVIKQMDARLGLIFSMIEGDTRLNGRTAIILTADHGGYGTGHSDSWRREVYTIPFYVWGPGITPGADLYDLNAGRRLDPGTGRPPYSAPLQPIRNGEAGNLTLDLLGLGPIPGSTINAAQDLIVPEPAMLLLWLLGMPAWQRRCFRRRRPTPTPAPSSLPRR